MMACPSNAHDCPSIPRARAAPRAPAGPPARTRPFDPGWRPEAAGPAARPTGPRGRRQPPPASRHLILFLAADPAGTTRLALGEECAAIEDELRMTPGRDDFDFRSKWAVSVDQMMRHLNEWQPAVLHFSGHGDRAGLRFRAEHEPAAPPRRDLVAEGSGGIQLHGERCPRLVSDRALAQMIAAAAPSTKVVVLNACFSDAVAEPLRHVVDCVVGMSGAIGDEAARAFAVGFYRALGNGRSVGNAVAQAIATLAAKQLPDEHLPVCRTRDGLRADRIFLSSASLQRP